MKIDLEQLFGYLNDLASALMPLFSVFGVLAGLYMLAAAAKSLVWRHSDGQPYEGNPNLGEIGIKILIAACLLQFSTSIEWTTNGLLAGTGSGTRDAMALVVTSTSPTWDMILKVSFLWLAAVGVMGMFKGFLLWHKAASGDSNHGDPFWAGLWHIVGGAILINIGTH